MGVNSDLEELASNTEYSATKCRITKPPPPKPATNPLQFVKVGPSPLYKKAQEQIKAVEEVKVTRQEVREDAEDWQHNLDNWKSSRRKRQEHIIERVEEVKKLEQEENERRRRKSTTFHEMVERRGRGRPKFNYPIYDEDANDLSDYGIGSSSSKTNSIKDVDTDDSSSVLDDNPADSACNKYNSSASNQSQSEDELCVKQKETYSTKNLLPNKIEPETSKNESKPQNDPEQYTYEGAIQDYRSRIRTKININESVFNKPLDSGKSKEFSEAQILLPKGNLFKRRELFDKGTVDVNSFESSTSRRISEELQNTQSIKERLERLGKCVDQPVKIDKNELPTVPVKSRLQNLNKEIDNNVANNNNKNNKTRIFDESGNTEEDIYMEKLNTINRDLDEFIPHYPTSASSTDLMTISSDREDSGIHTSDISCSISQSDEAFDDGDIPVNTTPKCIDTFNKQDIIEEKPKTIVDTNISKSEHEESALNANLPSRNDYSEILKAEDDYEKPPALPESLPEFTSIKEVILKSDYTELLKTNNNPEMQITDNRVETIPIITEKIIPETHPFYQIQKEEIHSPLVENIEKTIQEQDNISDQQDNILNDKIVIYENVEFPNYQMYPKYIDDIFEKPIEPPKLQPPTEKPPPPPPAELEDEVLLRQSSAKSIKKELNIKRSSFLGLDEPTPEITEENIFIKKPPDVNTFLQNESRLEKSIYKQLQGSLNSINSPNLDYEPGKEKLQNWLSTRSLNSKTNSDQPADEDEITKKEREIIELVEKEEKSRDYEYPNPEIATFSNTGIDHLGSEKFDNPYFPETLYNKIDEQDSEVLKVEHELLQLEREELERQRESLSFRKKNVKLRQNHHSYENIYDVDVEDGFEYRKSMPELQQPPLDFNKPLPMTSKPIDDDIQYRKSMPDIQRSYNRSVTEYPAPQRRYDMRKFTDHRKSMPDLQPEKSAFMPPAHIPPIMPGKPLKPLTKEQKEKFMILNSPEYDNLHANKSRPYNRHTLHALGAPPRPKNLTNDNWIQPKTNPEVKSYNQHWLFQEAELRRISEQKNPSVENRNIHEKRIPDPVLQSYSQKVYKGFIDRNSAIQMPELCNQKEYTQHPYLGHMQTLGHAQPMPFSPPTTGLEEGQDIMLSVSGKKKCSYCGNELGRGAAMIIESLCLFYHMECFKCCVCHMQLGDGLMGTDVRVRNQKLHCQNCYSSDDGIKFSCV